MILGGQNGLLVVDNVMKTTKFVNSNRRITKILNIGIKRQHRYLLCFGDWFIKLFDIES